MIPLGIGLSLLSGHLSKGQARRRVACTLLCSCQLCLCQIQLPLKCLHMCCMTFQVSMLSCQLEPARYGPIHMSMHDSTYWGQQPSLLKLSWKSYRYNRQAVRKKPPPVFSAQCPRLICHILFTALSACGSGGLPLTKTQQVLTVTIANLSASAH